MPRRSARGSSRGCRGARTAPGTARPRRRGRAPPLRPSAGVRASALLSIFDQEASELLAAARVAQLAQRLGLYLADSLARDVELLADFLEGVVGGQVDAEAHAQHLRLARRQLREHAVHGLAQRLDGRRVERAFRGGVLDEVAEVRILVVAD